MNDSRDTRSPRPAVPPVPPAEVFVPETPDTFDPDQAVVAPVRPEDFDAARALLEESVIEGHFVPEEVDQAFDALRSAEQTEPTEQPAVLMWVARHPSGLVGVVGLRTGATHVAAVKWLRVAMRARRRGVGKRLLEEALLHCQRSGCLKVVLEVELERTPVLDIFRDVGFQLHREREHDGHRTMEFFLDLYREPGL